MRTHGHREGSTTHWGLLGENRGGTAGVGSWGVRAWGEMPDIVTGRKAARMYLCNTLVCSSHVPPNLKCNTINN